MTKASTTKKKPSAAVKAALAPKPVAATKVSNAPLPKSGSQKRRTANFVFAVLYALGAAALPLFGAHKVAPITTQYLASDTLGTAAAGHSVLSLAIRHLVDAPLLWLAAAVLILMALMHLMMATLARARYEAQQKQGINAIRWTGFALSSGLIMVTLALLGGISQLSVLITIFVLTTVGGVLVTAAEQIQESTKGKGWLPHVICATPLLLTLLPWVIILCSVLSAVAYGGTTPTALWTLYGSMFGLYLLLAGVTHYRIMRIRQWADTAYAERAYMLLGLVTTGAFASQVFLETFMK